MVFVGYVIELYKMHKTTVNNRQQCGSLFSRVLVNMNISNLILVGREGNSGRPKRFIRKMLVAD